LDSAVSVLRNLKAQEIKVVSTVGDGFSSQLSALSPESPRSFQNARVPYHGASLDEFRSISYIYCSCRLLNFALDKAITMSHFLLSADSAVTLLANLLRKRVDYRLIGKRCPTYSPRDGVMPGSFAVSLPDIPRQFFERTLKSPMKFSRLPS
jgi:hypothetical protein